MTQYLLSVIHEAGVQEREFGPYADEASMHQAFADVGRFNTELEEAGALVFAGGLQPPSTATTVDATGADVITTDGPFAESKEYLGGFWVIEASDLDAALEWTRKASAACGQKLEIRPLQG